MPETKPSTLSLTIDRADYSELLCALASAVDKAKVNARESKDHPDQSIPAYWTAQYERFNALSSRISRAGHGA